MTLGRETAEADDKTKRTPRDSEFLSFDYDDEIDYWTTNFGVRREHLARAAARVGRSADAVENYISGDVAIPRDDEG